MNPALARAWAALVIGRLCRYGCQQLTLFGMHWPQVFVIRFAYRRGSAPTVTRELFLHGPRTRHGLR